LLCSVLYCTYLTCVVNQNEQFALNDKLNMEKEAQGAKQSAEDKRRAVEVFFFLVC
jgi:hypothetical protein